jgi:uncharacterized protein with PIN domain
MLVYCDSSALVKMVVDERESQDLEAWLEQQGAPQLCSSVIARTEVVRAVRRFGEDAVQLARGRFRVVSATPLTWDPREGTDRAKRPGRQTRPIGDQAYVPSPQVKG